MKLTSQDFDHEEPIPSRCALGKMDPETHFAFSANESPHLAWNDVPEGTRSFIVLCVDPDVPTVGNDVNQEGRSVPHDLPRTDFVHWLMVDVPADLRELAAGSCGRGVVYGGKSAPPGPDGARHGRNDFTDWFAGDATMGGTYLGYDGPAPPWNDERMHEYHFSVLALDVERLDVEGVFNVPEVTKAMAGHVLGQAELVGIYTLNPELADS